MKYTLAFGGCLIILCSPTVVGRVVIRIKGPQDRKFYESQNWTIIETFQYGEGENQPPLPDHIVLRTKEEVNTALVQAEIDHRLRHS